MSKTLISLILVFITITNTSNLFAEMARHDFPYKSHYVSVKGSKMHYVDTGGDGSIVLMIHGQPTWSYLWRNIIPYVEKNHRVIAMDLIGFGKSDKPDIEYKATDHAQYLKGFIEALQLKDITLVIHDWGSILGFDYAAKHPENVKAIAFMEAVVRTAPVEAPYLAPKPMLAGDKPKGVKAFVEILKQIKTPGIGEKMILEDNFFIETLIRSNLSKVMTEDEFNAYREPFAKGKNRLPMLQFPRDVPIDMKTPEYTANMIANYTRYLNTQEDLPKLLLHLSEGFLITRWEVQWMRENWSDLEIHNMGPGGHFMQEFNPRGIGQALASWLKKNNL